MEAMRKLSAMTEEERLSEENKELFEQAMKNAPLEIQPALIAIQKKYEHSVH
jgi:phage terminase large subunit-like protein